MKAGIRTSEGWLAAAVVLGCLAIALYQVHRGRDPGFAELLAAALASVGYGGSRAAAKLLG